jgi:GST-like protein
MEPHTPSATPQRPYTLYGAPGSGSAAIEIALARAGQTWREVRAATWLAGSAMDELGAVNPLRQVPTLVTPDGQVLTESAAILVGLGLAHPGSGLLPMDLAARSQVIRGVVWIAANCYTAIGVIDYPERWLPEGDEAARKALVAGARQRLHAHWDFFADQFPAAPWLSGDALGALDALAVVVSRWSGTRKHLEVTRPAFHELLMRIEAHPEVAPVIARHWPAN